jgi:hypothetical protein
VSEERPTATDAEDRKAELTRRDSDTQLALGIFVSIIAIPVIIGTLWADSTSTIVVNLVSGLTLLGLGLALAGYGFLGTRRNGRD